MTRWIALPALVAAAALTMNVEAAPKTTNTKQTSPKTTSKSSAPKQTAKAPSTKGPSAKSTSTKTNQGAAKAKAPKSTTTTTTTAKGNGSSKKSAPTTTASGTTTTTTTSTEWTPTNAVSEKLMSKPNQLARLKAVLPAGTDLNDATAGFKNFGQVNAAVNASRNLGIDFADLKAAMTGTTLAGEPTNKPTLSLGQAIQQYKPGVDGDVEAATATAQATRDGGQ
jgi:hypothetical protein